MAADRTPPMRALVGVRTGHRRAGEHALARAVVDERTATERVAAAAAARETAATAARQAAVILRELATRGAEASHLAGADAFAARLRRRLSDADTALAAAEAMRATAAGATTGRQRDLTASIADQRVAERALDRVTAEERRRRELLED